MPSSLQSPPLLDAAVRAQFEPETTFLNTATYGLPPRVAFEAFMHAAEEWRHGRCGFEGWDASVDRSRTAYAQLVGVPASWVAVGHQLSPLVGMVAAGLPAGTRVLCPANEFTSLVFPFLAHAARGVEVREVELDRLAEAIDARTGVVAFSAVQSLDGTLADLDAIVAAAAHHGALTVCDTTQAAGWLPHDASRFDVTLCSAYKWLMNPRGTAFLTVRPERVEQLVPIAAGWYAGEPDSNPMYGGPLRLAPGARAFDTSPAWLTWVGAAPALELLCEVGVEAVHAHDVHLADLLRRELGLPPAGSAIVALDVDEGAAERVAAAGILASARGGRLRLAFHLYNDEDDVERALGAIAPAR